MTFAIVVGVALISFVLNLSALVNYIRYRSTMTSQERKSIGSELRLFIFSIAVFFIYCLLAGWQVYKHITFINVSIMQILPMKFAWFIIWNLSNCHNFSYIYRTSIASHTDTGPSTDSRTTAKYWHLSGDYRARMRCQSLFTTDDQQCDPSSIFQSTIPVQSSDRQTHTTTEYGRKLCTG